MKGDTVALDLLDMLSLLRDYIQTHVRNFDAFIKCVYADRHSSFLFADHLAKFCPLWEQEASVWQESNDHPEPSRDASIERENPLERGDRADSVMSGRLGTGAEERTRNAEPAQVDEPPRRRRNTGGYGLRSKVPPSRVIRENDEKRNRCFLKED